MGGIAPFGGLWAAVELFRLSVIPLIIDSSIDARRGGGYKDPDHVITLAFSIWPEEEQWIILRTLRPNSALRSWEFPYPLPPPPGTD